MIDRLRTWLSRRMAATASRVAGLLNKLGGLFAALLPGASAETTRTSTRAEDCPCENTEDRGPIEAPRLLAGILIVVLCGAAASWVVTVPGSGQGLVLSKVGHLLVLAAVAGAAIGMVRNAEGYLAGIWLMSSLTPWVLAIATVVAYVWASENKLTDVDAHLSCIYLGVAVAMLFAVGTGFFGRSMASRGRAQAHVYDQLRDRRSQLRDRYTRLVETREQVDPKRREQFDTLCREAASRLAAVECELCDPVTGRPALRWARATGYSNILRTLHRVEELVLAAQPDEAVIGDSFNDFLSLSGSNIAERDRLMADLRAATFAIDDEAAATFFSPTGPTGPSARPTSTGPANVVAREILREVRFAINDFRDSRVDRQIGSRNSLMFVILAGAAVTYLMLGLAILAGVPTVAIESASVYFLVAALAGLLNRLRIEAARTTAVEDFGLGIVRLAAAPLLSGLAGVGGVYLVDKTPQLFSALFGTGQMPPAFAMAKIFDLTQNEGALLVALVFGFAPAAFFSSVQRQADRYAQEIEKTGPSGGSTTSSEQTTVG